MHARDVLAACFPAVWRVAHALCGSNRVGRNIAETVVHQSLTAMPGWRPGTPPMQWFYHHTVLAARAQRAEVSELLNDPLVEHIGYDDPAYVAFIRALRLLPLQQREAYLLHRGERLDPRMLGVAMDCSNGAAQRHLAAATAALTAIAGDGIAPILNTFDLAYQALTPEQVKIGPGIRARSLRVDFRRLLRLALPWTKWLILLATLTAVIWRFRGRLPFLYHLLRLAERHLRA